MRLLGLTFMIIGMLVAFGLPGLAVLQPGPLNLWQIIIPMVAGAAIVIFGRLIQPAYKARVRDR
jgi:hypothetical protein